MLTLPIKKKWFDMILSGEKKEEYREIIPYYTTRFKNYCGLLTPNTQCWVVFRNGYSSSSASFRALVSVTRAE